VRDRRDQFGPHEPFSRERSSERLLWDGQFRPPDAWTGDSFESRI